MFINTGLSRSISVPHQQARGNFQALLSQLPKMKRCISPEQTQNDRRGAFAKEDQRMKVRPGATKGGNRLTDLTMKMMVGGAHAPH